MSLYTYADRVQETSSTTGTGTLTLAGATTGYQSFATAFPSGTTNVTFCATDGTNWEVDQGVYTTSGTTLTRATVLASSNGGSKINFASTVTVSLEFAAWGSHNLQAPLALTTNTNSSTNPYNIDSTNGADYQVIHSASSVGYSYVMPSPTAGRHLLFVDSTGQLTTNPIFFIPHANETFNGVSAFALSGTSYHCTNGSGTVTATNSLFTTQLSVGCGITFSTQIGVTYIVTAITSATQITISPTFSGTTTTSATGSRNSYQYSTNNGSVLWGSDGTSWFSLGNGGPSAGNCSVTFTSTVPSTLNVSTAGTRDWFAPGGSYVENYRGSGSIGNEAYSKILGGRIHVSFDWVGNYSAGFTQSSSISISSNAADDSRGGLSSVATDQGIDQSSGSIVNWGYRFRVPADTYSRTLSIYGSVFSGVATLTVYATDGSFATVTNAQDSGSATAIGNLWTVTYNTAHDGQEIYVSVLVTTNHGSTANLKFITATLA